MTFEQALREQCEKTTDRKRRSKRILAVLNSKPSKRRTRQLERMEQHAKVELEMTWRVNIDWSEIDWSKVFETILKLLLALLPLLI